MVCGKVLEAVIKIAGTIDPSVQKAASSASKAISDMNKTVTAEAKQTEAATKSSSKIGKILSKVKVGFVAAAAAATTAATAIGVYAVKSVNQAATFETQMANVGTLLDGSTQQVKDRLGELGDDVLKVSNNTGVASSELTDGLYQIISAVGDSEGAIKQMEVAAKAATAGGATTTDAINLLTAVTKGYGDTSEEAFQKASDLSFVTVKLGQTSFAELASSMGKVVPLASALNVSQEELYGTFATLTGVTGSTAEVATQMKAVMSGLMSPSENMTKALQKLGYSNATAALESLGFQGTLKALGGAVGDDTQSLAKLFSSVEAQTAILSLAGSQSDNLTEKTKAMYEATGATDRAFGTATDTLEHTIKTLKNLGANFTTAVGRKILPVVKDVAQKALPAITEGLDNLEPVLNTVIQACAPVFGVIGKAASSLSPLLQSGLSGVIVIAQQLGPVFTKIGAWWDGISPSIMSFAQGLLPQLMQTLKALSPIISAVFSGIAPWFGMITQLAGSLLPAILNVLKLIQPIIQFYGGYIGGVISGLFTIINGQIQNIINVICGVCDVLNNIFVGDWAAAWESAKQVVKNVASALVGIFLAPVNGIITLINSAISGINNIGFTIPDWVPGIGGKAFNVNIPTIPMVQLPAFAAGGFTTGPSIAGEAGTEAVISFNRAYRGDNLNTWAKAGQMLGVDDTLVDALAGKGSRLNNNNLTFAPNITINGDANKSDVLEAIREAKEEFLDLMEEFWDERGPEYE